MKHYILVSDKWQSLTSPNAFNKEVYMYLSKAPLDHLCVNKHNASPDVALYSPLYRLHVTPYPISSPLTPAFIPYPIPTCHPDLLPCRRRLLGYHCGSWLAHFISGRPCQLQGHSLLTSLFVHRHSREINFCLVWTWCLKRLEIRFKGAGHWTGAERGRVGQAAGHLNQWSLGHRLPLD